MKINAIQAGQVSSTDASASALRISRSTLRTVRTGLQAGTRPYVGIRVTYIG